MSEGKPAANRMTLMMFKARLLGATKGHKMLKKKRDHMKAVFHEMLKDIVATKKAVGNAMNEATFSYNKAQWACDGVDISSSVIGRVSAASITCKLLGENIAGVQLPRIDMKRDKSKDVSMQTLGFSQGGAIVGNWRDTSVTVLEKIIKLASLQTSFVMLDAEIKMTSRRVNALEYVLIPKIHTVIAYINQEMDEAAREEFYRVKSVVKKKRVQKEKEAEKAAKEALVQESQQVGGIMEYLHDPEVVF